MRAVGYGDSVECAGGMDEGDWEGAIRYMSHLEDKIDRQHKAIARLYARVSRAREPGHHCVYRQAVEAVAQMVAGTLREWGL